jgi:hypothetical protein
MRAGERGGVCETKLQLLELLSHNGDEDAAIGKWKVSRADAPRDLVCPNRLSVGRETSSLSKGLSKRVIAKLLASSRH